MSEEWRLLSDSPAPGAWNMAVDETLLTFAMQGAGPVLRLYSWRPAALSLGCFQDAGVVDFAACRREGIDVVRRPTGGRAVLHDNEVTYAIVLPPEHPIAKLGVVASCRVLSEGLVRGLARLRVQATLAMPARERPEQAARLEQVGQSELPERPEGPEQKVNTGFQAACFDAPSWYELMAMGRKLVGSAQVRRGGALLQHGSVPLRMDNSRLYKLLKFSDEAGRTQAAHRLSDKAAGLVDLTGCDFAWDEVAQALSAGVQEALKCTYRLVSLTTLEQTTARQLALKHTDPVWVMRKQSQVRQP